MEEPTFNSFDSELVKRKRTSQVSLKQLVDSVRTKFHKKDVAQNPYECSAILKISSVYVQGKKWFPQTYLEECKYKEIPMHCASSVSDSDEDDEDFTPV